MRIILLSGGSGKRLWPLSNDVRSKQFLRLLPGPDGQSESMIQRVVRQITAADLTDRITIATGASQIDPIRAQLNVPVDIVTEPERRNTFPAIALATAWLVDNGCSLDEPVAVIPCDVFADQSYFDALHTMADALDHDRQLILMGIPPTSNSPQYGYILPEISKNTPENDKPVINPIERFYAHPEAHLINNIIAKGALWNAGVFTFRPGFVLNVVKEKVGHSDYAWLEQNFSQLPRGSFDSVVVEHTDGAYVMTYTGAWKDLGTWDAMSREMTNAVQGYVVNSPDVRNTHVVNELDIPIVCAGVDGLIVSASPDGILIADKEASDSLKEHVALVHARPMFEERRWGYYKVLGQTHYPDGHSTLTKLLHLNPGCSISYQVHRHRDEVWTFVDGEALLVIDGEQIRVGRGHVANIRAGQMHAVKALTDIEIIEVQAGDSLVEEDIERYPYHWQ